MSVTEFLTGSNDTNRVEPDTFSARLHEELATVHAALNGKNPSGAEIIDLDRRLHAKAAGGLAVSNYY